METRSFTMADDTEPYEAKNAQGQIWARFLPGKTYRVTTRNFEIAAMLVGTQRAAYGTARLTMGGTNVAAEPGKISGSVTVNE